MTKTNDCIRALKGACQHVAPLNAALAARVEVLRGALAGAASRRSSGEPGVCDALTQREDDLNSLRCTCERSVYRDRRGSSDLHRPSLLLTAMAEEQEDGCVREDVHRRSSSTPVHVMAAMHFNLGPQQHDQMPKTSTQLSLDLCRGSDASGSILDPPPPQVDLEVCPSVGRGRSTGLLQ